MPSLETLLAVIVATALFAYMPGPSTLYAAAQTIARGRRGGWMAALGIHLGGYVHVVAAAFGLAVLFSLVPVLYTVLKIAGAGYLIWLGIRLILSKNAVDVHSGEFTAKSPRKAFYESMIVEVLNPKTAIFYVAFLPQFTELSAALPVWAQLLILGTIVNVMFSSADVLCVLLADRVVTLFKESPSANRVAERIGGGLLALLGLNLALNRQ